MPFVLFYPHESSANFSNLERHDRFKKSLSEVLTHFYPLAGRVKEKLYVDCNDEGVHYEEFREERETIGREKRMYEEKNIFHVDYLRCTEEYIYRLN
jgi:hypothetical protein